MVKAKRKARAKAPAQSSATQQEATRSEKVVQGRPPRVRMGATGNLDVSKAILDDIKKRGCVARWALDDQKGKMARYEGAWWEIYKDASGRSVTRPSGGGRQHILIMLPLKLREEDMALKRQDNNAILEDKAKLESGDGYKEYIPDGHEYVISPDV